MFNNKIKRICLSIIFCTFIFNPANAVDVLDESILDDNFDAALHAEIVEDKDVAELSLNSEVLESQIAKLESDLQIVISKINAVESGLKSLAITEEDLKKYSSTEKVDVSEKEVYKGVSYDLDIFDHGKKLVESDSEDFYAEYLEL